MTLFTNNSCVFLVVLITAISFIYYFIFTFKRLKITENEKLNILISEIYFEKNIKLSLKNTTSKIDALEKKTNVTFKKINVSIFNIDFSYKEVLSNI